jgi:tetratricopeptide (TPR) repeat protein
MPFVAAKCPSCGASLSVPDDKDYVVCDFCKSNVKVREAVRLYTEVDIPDWLILADSAMKMGKYNEGLHYYIKILEVDAKVAQAWLGRAEATGKLLLQNISDSLSTPEGGTQVIKGFDGNSHVVTANISNGKTVYLRNQSGQFKDLNQIFAEIGKAFSGKNYYNQASIRTAFNAYNDYLKEIKAYINNAETYTDPMEIVEIKSKSISIYIEIIDGLYNRLKSAYSDSYLSMEDLFEGYLDYSTGYLTDLEEIRNSNPGNLELTRILYRISSENSKTASDFLAVPGTVNQRLSDFKAQMKQKEDLYLGELEEAAKKS